MGRATPCGRSIGTDACHLMRRSGRTRTLSGSLAMRPTLSYVESWSASSGDAPRARSLAPWPRGPKAAFTGHRSCREAIAEGSFGKRTSEAERYARARFGEPRALRNCRVQAQFLAFLDL